MDFDRDLSNFIRKSLSKYGYDAVASAINSLEHVVYIDRCCTDLAQVFGIHRKNPFKPFTIIRVESLINNPRSHPTPDQFRMEELDDKYRWTCLQEPKVSLVVARPDEWVSKWIILGIEEIPAA